MTHFQGRNYGKIGFWVYKGRKLATVQCFANAGAAQAWIDAQ